ncbi:hypothetical protein AB0C52_25940 [Streptomyces sp. NPDC048717]|uniref:hypothetical protein n=1 Tax=unclassified Streptomyces TaxID=2593676 RepID=UPI0034424CE8
MLSSTAATAPATRSLSGLPGLPALIPGPLAAEEAGVAPATIRKWVQLGHLRAAGKAGRAQLFRLEDVFAAERAARRRPRTA